MNNYDSELFQIPANEYPSDNEGDTEYEDEVETDEDIGDVADEDGMLDKVESKFLLRNHKDNSNFIGLPWVENQDETIFLSKSNYKWSDKSNENVFKARIENLIKNKRGLTSSSKDAESEIDFFNLFLNDKMLEIILHHTNQKLNNLKSEKNFELEKNKYLWNPIQMHELMAYIGVKLLRGLNNDQNIPTKSLWGKGDLFSHRPIYSAICSRDRFKKIQQCIRFDDLTTRSERSQTDRLAPIREIVEIFIENCRKMYIPSPFLTIDEQLLKFHGKCKFRMYIASKPDRYGIKIWVMVDEYNYVVAFQVYLGKEIVRETDQGKRVVLDFAKMVQAGSHFTFDNFFTSIPLVDELEKMKITCMGTLRSNKREIPEVHKADKRRPEGSSIFTFNEKKTLVSYVPKPGKVVFLLSTFHQGREIVDKTGKPKIVHDYNLLKCYVDVMDQKISYNTCKSPTLRWPLRVFENLIDIATINGNILFDLKNSSNTSRFDYLRATIYFLIKDQLAFRNVHHNLPHDSRIFRAKLLNSSAYYTNLNKLDADKSINNSLNSSFDDSFNSNNSLNNSNSSNELLPPTKKKSRLRCFKCLLDKKRSDSQFRCSKCSKPICKNHRTKVETNCISYYCSDCLKNNN